MSVAPVAMAATQGKPLDCLALLASSSYVHGSLGL